VVAERSDTADSEVEFHLPFGIEVGSIHGSDAKPSAVTHRCGCPDSSGGSRMGTIEQAS